MAKKQNRNYAFGSSLPSRRKLLQVGLPLSLGIFILIIWQAITYWNFVPNFVLPTPVKVLEALIAHLMANTLPVLVLHTFGQALLGACIGASIGLIIGYLMAKSHYFASTISPYVAASQALPAVALAPLLVIWFGYGLLPVVLLCALFVFFPVLLATRLGIRSIDPHLIEAANIDGAAGWKISFYIELPIAIPAIITGLRNGFTLSITGAVVGEMVMGSAGLGEILASASASFDSATLFATLLVITILAALMHAFFGYLENFIDPSKETRR